MTILLNIRTYIPVIDTAVELLKEIDARFRAADKSLAGTLMAKLTTMKYDGSRSMQEHIIEMTNIAARLNTLNMTVAEGFLVRFILNSLPPLYGPFQINYNSLKEKWNVNELSNMLVQEEARLKQQGNFVANVMSESAHKKKWKPKKGSASQPPKVEGPFDALQAKKDKSFPCHFCKKKGHFLNECLKRKAWFEKKGIPFKPKPKTN